MKSTTTKYICDKCGKDFVFDTDLVEVTIIMRFTSKVGSARTQLSEKKDICPDCLHQIGFGDVIADSRNEYSLSNSIKKYFIDIMARIFKKDK